MDDILYHIMGVVKTILELLKVTAAIWILALIGLFIAAIIPASTGLGGLIFIAFLVTGVIIAIALNS